MSRALSVKQAIALSDAWHRLDRSCVFLVAKGREFLVEPPNERQDRDEDDIEAVLRVFLDAEDAWMYCEQQQENYKDEADVMRVRGFSMEELFKLRPAIQKNAAADFSETVRADVCELINGEPIVRDTLWSSEIPIN